MCYLLHIYTAVLCFIDFCIELCNCLNARLRYNVTYRYSNVGKQGLKLIFMPNSINCSDLARHPASCPKFATQHIKMFHNHQTTVYFPILCFFICSVKHTKICSFLMQVSSYLFSPHAPAIKRSQSNQIPNVFVCA